MIRFTKIITSILVLTLIVNASALVDLSNARANSVIVQSNGQIVAAGVANVGNVVQGLVTRYNTNGTMDNTFGTNGVVTTVVGDNATYNAVIQQSDGKIVAGGSAGLTNAEQFIVVRYNSDGSLDNTFGNQGIATSVLSASTSVVNAIAQQTNGQLILVGTSNSTNFVPRIFLARLNGNGTFDTSFGTNGVTFTSVGNFADGEAVAIQSDGKIVVGANVTSAFITLRYTTSGILDTTFGNSGSVVNSFGGVFANSNSLLLQSDGKIVQGGFSDNNFGLIRLTASGVLDSGFGTGGRATTPFAAPAEIFGLAIQSNGNIIGAGYMDNQIALARYTTTGALDTTYGTNGQVTTQVGSMARALSVALQSDGKAVIAGYSSPNMLVSRYTTTGTVDSSFGFVESPFVCDTALCAYAQIYNVSQVDILNNQTFTFDSNGSMQNITHTPGSSTIVIGLSGTYLITYIIQANSPSNIQLLQNGSVVAQGSYISQGSALTIGEAIITANTGDQLTLLNVSGFDIFLPAGAVNANITLSKIA